MSFEEYYAQFEARSKAILEAKREEARQGCEGKTFEEILEMVKEDLARSEDYTKQGMRHLWELEGGA